MNSHSQNSETPGREYDKGKIDRLIRAADEAGFLCEPLIAQELREHAGAEPLPPGFSVDGYSFVDILASGGTATVYKAMQTKVANREVAIKVYHRLQLDSVASSLQDEIATMARLDHPNLASILDAGRLPDGRTYVVQPLLSGERLDEYCKKRDLEAGETAAIFRQIASAVHEMNRLGYVHCDLKPQNVLVNSQGVPTVTDFDSARLVGTVSDLVQGTVGYLAPEQVTNQKVSVDERTDVYGLGATLYHTLCGHPPFVEGSISGKLVATVFDEVVPPHVENPAVPEALSKICMRCLEKMPSDRYESAEEFAIAIDEYSMASPAQRQGPAKKTNWMLGGATLACLAMVLTALLVRFFHAPSAQSVDAVGLDATRKLRDTLISVGPGERLAGKPREEGLRAVAEQLLQAWTQSPDDHSLAHEYAVASWCLGNYLREEGNYKESLNPIQCAIDTYETLIELDFRREQVQFDLFHAHHGMAHVVENLGDVDQVMHHKQRAFDLIQELYASEPDSPDIADCYAASLIARASARESEMPSEWSEKQYSKALEIALALRENPAASVLNWRHRTDASWYLARVYLAMGQSRRAMQCYEDSIRYANEMVAADPNDWGYRCDRITALQATCSFLLSDGLRERATELLAKADADLEWLRIHRPDTVHIETFERERQKLLRSWEQQH